MPKTSSVYICQQCGFRTSQFLGRCPECGTWNSLVETLEQPLSPITKTTLAQPAQIVNLKDVAKTDYQRLDTRLAEFNRVLGGGIVLGSVVLVSGDPGIGKSTLLTQLAINLTPAKQSNNAVLYIAGEESPRQIKIRADRIKKNALLSILNETDVDIICATITKFRPSLAIIDSIQTLETQDLTSAAGSVGQVRECAHRLQKLAKALHIPLFIVGHVTKEGTVAGPKTLEHLVDVVLNLEGDPSNNLRLLRTTKNRFGATDEVGVFEMEEQGLIEVKNPSRLFLDQKVNAPGSVVVPTVNGLRPILVEIQALVTKSFLPIPRRVGNGIDPNRLQLLVAVLSKRLNLPLFDQDIFVNVTGGIKVTETATDLGIALAIVSSFKDKSVNPRTALVGEVGLLGELRPVRNLDKRSAEAAKLGFSQIISPQNAKTLAQVVSLVLG